MNPDAQPDRDASDETSLALATFPILSFFRFEHLPSPRREEAERFALVAREIASVAAVKVLTPAARAEVEAGLRKLLEAKDCFVRAAVP